MKPAIHDDYKIKVGGGLEFIYLDQSRWIHSTISFSKSIEYFKIYPKDNTSGINFMIY